MCLKKFKPLCGLLAFVSMVPLSGCQSLWATLFEMENPYCTVEESGLNWIEIHQYELDGAKRRVRLRIDGNGLVDVTSGTSMLVSNDFAYKNDESTWADVTHERIRIDPKDAVVIFQQLVDKGLFVKPEFYQAPKVPNHVAVLAAANIEHKTVSSVNPITEPPELVEQLKLTVLMFYHPQPKRRR